MNLKQYCQNESISQTDVKIKESATSKYEGTDIPVMYVRLPKPLSDGKSYLVCSKGLAQAQKTDKKAVTCHSELSYDEEFGWGLIREDTSKEVDVEW